MKDKKKSNSKQTNTVVKNPIPAVVYDNRYKVKKYMVSQKAKPVRGGYKVIDTYYLKTEKKLKDYSGLDIRGTKR